MSGVLRPENRSATAAFPPARASTPAQCLVARPQMAAAAASAYRLKALSPGPAPAPQPVQPVLPPPATPADSRAPPPAPETNLRWVFSATAPPLPGSDLGPTEAVPALAAAPLPRPRTETLATASFLPPSPHTTSAPQAAVGSGSHPRLAGAPPPAP